jgi:hypothetical protein
MCTLLPVINQFRITIGFIILLSLCSRSATNSPFATGLENIGQLLKMIQHQQKATCIYVWQADKDFDVKERGS